MSDESVVAAAKDAITGAHTRVMVLQDRSSTERSTTVPWSRGSYCFTARGFQAPYATVSVFMRGILPPSD